MGKEIIIKGLLLGGVVFLILTNICSFLGNTDMQQITLSIILLSSVIVVCTYYLIKTIDKNS